MFENPFIHIIHERIFSNVGGVDQPWVLVFWQAFFRVKSLDSF